MSGSGQKRLFFEISLVPFTPLQSREEPRRVNGAFPLSLFDLFNDRPLARLNHIGSVLALDVAIITQARRLPIDREGTDLHGLRQALPDSEPGSCGAAAGGALFCPGRTSMFADDFPIPVGKSHLVRRRCRCWASRGRSARARWHVDNLIGRWVDDHDVVADDKEIISVILGQDL